MIKTFGNLWKQLRRKKFREQFVASELKRGIAFQIQAMLKHMNTTQADVAEQAGITQGVVSRAADPDYGNLTLNTIIRIAAGFDVAFIGEFVPFSRLYSRFTSMSEARMGKIRTFSEEDSESEVDDARQSSTASVGRITPRTHTAPLKMTTATSYITQRLRGVRSDSGGDQDLMVANG